MGLEEEHIRVYVNLNMQEQQTDMPDIMVAMTSDWTSAHEYCNGLWDFAVSGL